MNRPLYIFSSKNPKEVAMTAAEKKIK